MPGVFKFSEFDLPHINMSPKSYKKCAVVNCKDCEGKTLHIFPVSNIDREKVYITNLMKKWIDFCKNPKITLENYKYKSSFIGVESHSFDDRIQVLFEM